MGVIVEIGVRRNTSSNSRRRETDLAIAGEGKFPIKSGDKGFPFERYGLPFFNSEQNCAWDVVPTGDYGADYATGKCYADQFLQSFDGAADWGKLLACIVSDMMHAKSARSGQTDANGIVKGFMHRIGHVLAAYRTTFAPAWPSP